MLGLEVFHKDQDPMVEEFGQSSIILRMLTISNFDSYIYIYIVIHVDIVHLSQFLKFFQVKRH